MKTDNDHPSITHLGGPGWRWTKAEVVASINAGTNTFYTFVEGKRADLHVVKGNPPYVQTAADGKWTNNLLALPACTAAEAKP
jgi:hypothetical protein